VEYDRFSIVRGVADGAAFYICARADSSAGARVLLFISAVPALSMPPPLLVHGLLQAVPLLFAPGDDIVNV
jgi:hypothetical protein